MSGISRRDVIKAQAVAAAAAAAGLPVPAAAQNLVTHAHLTDLKWSKAACRFCGTGCSIMSRPRQDAWLQPTATLKQR